MRSRISHFVAAVALLICLVCPIVEMFDYWDHTAQTGSDTEYIFVIIGLCIGAMYAFTRYVVVPHNLQTTPERLCRAIVQSVLHSSIRDYFFVIPIPLSPPVVNIRI
jgi:phosphotransferase system  glucose/maltose/N-acetylglucosamine-specific IIC component